MTNNSEEKICKNKKCNKILPKDYKYKYCEACRNTHANNTKNALKIVLSAAGVAVLAVAKIAGDSKG